MIDHQIIKNRDRLTGTDLRRQALDIVESGIQRVLPSTIMESGVSFDRLTASLLVNQDRIALTGRLFVIGAGKASGLMAQTLERILGSALITAGLVIEKAQPADFTTQGIRILQAGHPIPDQRGVSAVEAMLALKTRYSIDRNDLVLCLISGGGSALMPCPVEGISLADKQAMTRLLLESGANISEINSVRKHLSRTKGGRLAAYFAPARVISLILSDVIGNDLEVIASGPTYPDQSTFAGAVAVLQKYHLWEKTPPNVQIVLQKGVRGEIPETPKILDNAHNYIIGDLELALAAMAEKARAMGFNPYIITAQQKGETSEAAAALAAQLLGGAYSGYDALLVGGETTPALPSDHGVGGRNQHFAACTLQHLEAYPGKWVLASVGTDGSDFMPDVAGAIVDNDTLKSLAGQEAAFRQGLRRYDSHHWLAVPGNSLIVTGNTHTNVGDIMVYLLAKESAP
jgi:glycerate 2-kinase